jgi:hypothetical protein
MSSKEPDVEYARQDAEALNARCSMSEGRGHSGTFQSVSTLVPLVPEHLQEHRDRTGAAALAIAHSLTTAHAAPINWSQRAVANDESALAELFRRFEQWQAARAILQLATFLVRVWVLLVAQRTLRG